MSSLKNPRLQSGSIKIPQITESQLKFLKEVCNIPGMCVFSQSSPLPDDPLDAVFEHTRAEKDVEYLISIGLVKEISSEHQEQLEKMKAASGRAWRVFQVQDPALVMFNNAASTTIH